MKASTLRTLEPLLTMLRSNSALLERRPAEFHFEGREFLHFHELPDGVVADVLLKTGRVSMRATSPAQQAELVERIADVLDALESHARDRRRRSYDRRPMRQ